MCEGWKYIPLWKIQCDLNYQFIVSGDINDKQVRVLRTMAGARGLCTTVKQRISGNEAKINQFGRNGRLLSAGASDVAIIKISGRFEKFLISDTTGVARRSSDSCWFGVGKFWFGASQRTEKKSMGEKIKQKNPLFVRVLGLNGVGSLPHPIVGPGRLTERSGLGGCCSTRAWCAR